VFFDDYANSLLLGSTMRPVTDRLRISREKLAFLVDSTAAPVAGLAIVSTWVGFEVGVIADSFARVADANSAVATSGDGYGTFLATLPYRFYPLFLLAFVLMIAWTGRDFGAMWRAEQRALTSHRPDEGRAKPQAEAAAPGTLWNAVVPLGVLLGGIMMGFWVSGRGGGEGESPSLWQIVSNADSNRVLLISSFVASATAVLMAVASGSLSLAAAAAAWLDGARSMLLGAAILVLAWAIAMVCDAEHLNTAGYLIEVSTGRLNIAWMPAVAFSLSSAVSFATGSSWATMGLLIPLVISVTCGLMAGDPSLDAGALLDRQPLMLASVGSVLAGSIFGDHCSPISDTTVLSSVASDCDHLAHVMTQLPYAFSVGFVALAIGCLPVGLGMSPWILLSTGGIALWVLVRVVGRPVE
jgi:Na+/H+ antiporter NhaC